jgi:hypothetical protein
MKTDALPQLPTAAASNQAPPGSLQSFDDALRLIARNEGFRMDLVDHRRRRFVHRFFAAGSEGCRALVVWGVSASGASRVVAWSPGHIRQNGRRLRQGWGPKRAEAIAEKLNAAAVAWCKQYGPVPKPKTSKKK